MSEANPPFTPDWVSPPGESLECIMEEESWTVEDLGKRLHLSIAEVQDLLNGDMPIDASLALRIQTSVRGSAEFWLARERNYRASCARLGITPGVAAK